MIKVKSIGNDSWSRYEKRYGESAYDNPRGKINLGNQPIFRSHRSGWEYAIDALVPLHNPAGTKVDSFIEKNFAWDLSKEIKNKNIPYRDPWIGFVHNPPGVPEWFYKKYCFSTIFNRDILKESLETCVGLYSLSEYLSNHITKMTGIKSEALIHPTETPDEIFSFDKFITNENKKIINIGYWLRKQSSIYNLPFGKGSEYKKVRLIPYKEDKVVRAIKDLLKREGKELIPEYAENVYELCRISNEQYDKVLSENIVFLDLYNASANNAVIECIARATPILVNRIPAAEEYLGKDYPFYFSSLNEAAEKAKDYSLVEKTHEYLRNCEVRGKLSQEYFRESFEKSSIYCSL